MTVAGRRRGLRQPLVTSCYCIGWEDTADLSYPQWLPPLVHASSGVSNYYGHIVDMPVFYIRRNLVCWITRQHTNITPVLICGSVLTDSVLNDPWNNQVWLCMCHSFNWYILYKSDLNILKNKTFPFLFIISVGVVGNRQFGVSNFALQSLF